MKMSFGEQWGTFHPAMIAYRQQFAQDYISSQLSWKSACRSLKRYVFVFLSNINYVAFIVLYRRAR